MNNRAPISTHIVKNGPAMHFHDVHMALCVQPLLALGRLYGIYLWPWIEFRFCVFFFLYFSPLNLKFAFYATRQLAWNFHHWKLKLSTCVIVGFILCEVLHSSLVIDVSFFLFFFPRGHFIQWEKIQRTEAKGQPGDQAR